LSRRKTRIAILKARAAQAQHDERAAAVAQAPRGGLVMRAVLRNHHGLQAEGPRLAGDLRLLQHIHGNAFVQRLMGPAAIQRQPRAQAASRAVPGLAQDVVDQIATHLETGRQAALDALATALAGRGSIDPSYLIGSALNYVEDSSRMAPGHFGHTSLSAGTGRPRPCIIDIGPDAFRTVNELYATVMHEWQHVLQFRRPEAASEAADELEARLWEVENLAQTGLSRNLEYLRWMRNDLNRWWRQLGDVEKAAFNERYEAARLDIEDALMRLQTGR
jgi:hypothetical protein